MPYGKNSEPANMRQVETAGRAAGYIGIQMEISILRLASVRTELCKKRFPAQKPKSLTGQNRFSGS
nr:MAG TPA_asm: hypothetical protein [Caudoviricetes sp.]